MSVFTGVPINGETWLICGGRDFDDQKVFESAMSALINLRGCPALVVTGGANGADRMGEVWANYLAISHVCVPADWDRDGKAAGPIRNQRMIDQWKPVFVVAVPGGKGTADMVARAKIAKISVAEIKKP